MKRASVLIGVRRTGDLPELQAVEGGREHRGAVGDWAGLEQTLSWCSPDGPMRASACAIQDAIAAIVIGGTSLFGGVGTIIGTVVGVFIPAVLRNGFVIVGVQPFWQQVAVGAVLIIAVYLDQLRRSRYSR